MRVLVIYAHPNPESFNAAVHQAVLRGLKAAGHAVDDLDLYAEGFNPVMSREERGQYHDLAVNRLPVARNVERLLAAEAVVFVFPTWSFGEPAILKGWFDRTLIPGVSFKLVEGKATPNLANIRAIAGVVTYGRPWWMVRLAVGDLPRRHIIGYFRHLCPGPVKKRWLAHYNMNQATPATRARFLAKVEAAMRAFG